MEHVECHLYGFDDAKFLLRAKSRITNEGKKFFKLEKCRRCGLVYLNPRPEKEEIKKYYHPRYHSRTHKKDQIKRNLNLFIAFRRKCQFI